MREAVAVKQLSVRTSKKALLEIDEFKLTEGGRCVLIGPSGAGKSTLLKCIAALQPFSSGDIYLFGEKIEKKNIRLLRKKMVYVAQNEVMFQGTVETNIAMGLKFRSYIKAERKNKIGEVLKLLGLEGYEKRDVESLSGGEIQRVSLARALVIEPEILILDEPTANLDPYNVQVMERAIVSYCEEKGATLLLATHNMNQAKRIGQQVIFIVNGKIKESGDLPKQLDHPETKELIEFLEWA